MNITETERLYLREIRVEDAEQAYLLNLDPEVIRYTGDVAFASVGEARSFLENYDHYRVYGFGRWAVIHKQSGDFLGWCGLKYTKALDEYDIGFRFFKKHWSQGYATEAALACLSLGFSRWKMPRVVGRVMEDNQASIRVLQKIGLHYVAPYDFEGERGLIYAIEKNKAGEETA
jgi:ribosomal-protein-alanine N-acetyltransferase